MTRRWRWVSLNPTDSYVIVWKRATKPQWHHVGERWISTTREGLEIALCRKEFARAIGVTIQPGTCVKVDFGKVRVLPEKKGKK